MTAGSATTGAGIWHTTVTTPLTLETGEAGTAGDTHVTVTTFELTLVVAVCPNTHEADRQNRVSRTEKREHVRKDPDEGERDWLDDCAENFHVLVCRGGGIDIKAPNSKG